jgi:integrase
MNNVAARGKSVKGNQKHFIGGSHACQITTVHHLVQGETNTLAALRERLGEPDHLTHKKAWFPCPQHADDTAAQFSPNDLRRQILYPALAAAGIRRVRFHDARHTFASLLLQQGESPTYVKDQLGHSSIQMTVDVYGHLIPGHNRQAVDKLDDALAGDSETKTKSEYL